ncbi:hypothetical protein TUBRATIS_002880 [Tubulinosema ratisbonensis]|uniref:Uncharacterized protein n=1 Tax=Tubulinosema ratisbonensis TaxID=291195 RepID=A0A437APW9_9MICR|nr:hypothetical protein TUBRATIS_002880 [Tubulinosema ratisbonensis]
MVEGKKVVTDTVYFLNKLTVEEEYEIINAEVKEALMQPKEVMKPVIRQDGNIFYRNNEDLYEEMNLNPKPIDISQKSLYPLITSILFLPPFYNFLEEFKRNSTNFSESDTFFKIYEFFKYFQQRNAKFVNLKFLRLELALNSDFTDLFKTFNELLQTLHEESIKRFFYTENSWKDASESLAKPKQIFSEYSPIMDLFQLKIKKNSHKKSNLDIEFTTSFEVDCSKIEFTKFIHSISPFEGKFSIIKYSHIISFKLTNCHTPLPQKISMKDKSYRLMSLVCKEEEDYFCVVNNNGWYRIGKEVHKISTIDTGTKIEMAFYLATNYDFDF